VKLANHNTITIDSQIIIVIIKWLTRSWWQTLSGYVDASRMPPYGVKCCSL